MKKVKISKVPEEFFDSQLWTDFNNAVKEISGKEKVKKTEVFRAMPKVYELGLKWKFNKK